MHPGCGSDAAQRSVLTAPGDHGGSSPYAVSGDDGDDDGDDAGSSSDYSDDSNESDKSKRKKITDKTKAVSAKVSKLTPTKGKPSPDGAAKDDFSKPLDTLSHMNEVSHSETQVSRKTKGSIDNSGALEDVVRIMREGFFDQRQLE